MEKQMKMKTKEAFFAYTVLVLIVVSICAGVGAGVVYACKYIVNHDKAILYLVPIALIVISIRLMSKVSDFMKWNYVGNSSAWYFFLYVVCCATCVCSSTYLLTLIFG